MTVPQRITLVTLGVADVARSTAFYESLGWRRAGASVASTTFFNTAGPVVSLFGLDDLTADAGLAPGSLDAPGRAPVTLAINLESRESVDAAYADWVAAGGAPVRPPAAADWGGYTSYVADPDGHLWELAHNPFFPLDAEGRMTALD